MQTTISFLNALYGDLPEGAYIEIWEKDSKLSSYAATFEDAATMAHSAAGDVYFGVCLGGKGVPHLRHKATDKTFAPAIWVDIDVESPHHGKANLAPNTNAVFSVLSSECPIIPSCVVETGGGVHAYWFLDELLDMTDGDLDRGRFAAVVKGWQALVRDIFARRGWHGGVDPTHDLARVLRVPGSYNVSANFKSELRSLYEDMRYPLDEFEQYTSLVLTSEERAVTFINDRSWGHIDVVPRRGHSEEDFKLRSKVEALLATNENFRASYSGYNPNLQNDDSRSSIDFSLAVSMCRCHTDGEAYFSDQDICDVLVDLRFKFAKNWKDEKKAMRRDYYQSTIGKARKLIADEKAVEQTVAAPVPVEKYERPFSETLGEAPRPDVAAQDICVDTTPSVEVATLAVPEEAEDDSPYSYIPRIHPAKRDVWQEKVGDWLGYVIHRAALFENDEPPSVHLVLSPKGSSRMGLAKLPVSGIGLSRAKATECFLQATLRLPKNISGDSPCTKGTWQEKFAEILELCPAMLMPEESTEEGNVVVALKEYIVYKCGDQLERLSVLTDAPIGEAGGIGGDAPFLYVGRLHIALPDFSKHLRVNGGYEGLSIQKLGKIFASIGFGNSRVCNYRDKDGKKKGKRAFAVPNSFLKKHFGDVNLNENQEAESSPFDKGEVRRISLQ